MISFSQTGGTSGITQITISATSTQELADVVNHYTLGNESTSLDMPVIQKAYVPVQKYITMSPSAITWSSSNNTGSITINSNDSWVVVSDGWIQVSRMYESDISERYNSVSGNGNTIIGISCFENIGDARSGGITAYCQSDSAISATTTVSQAGGYVKPYITLGTYSMQVSGGSVTTAVTVQSNTTWSAITDSRWITINTLSGSGNGNVSFVVDANSSNIERRATITVFNGEINAVLVLTQAASVSRPYIILSPNSFSVPYEGSTGNTISVSANCDYDIDADVPWITVNAVSGSGDGSVSFSTSASSSTASSIGNIVFSNSDLSRYVSVERSFIPYLSASTTSISTSSGGGDYEIYVYSNVNWSVSVDEGEVEEITPWLSAMPSSGSNNGSIRVSVLSGDTTKNGNIKIDCVKYGLSVEISIERKVETVLSYNCVDSYTYEDVEESDIPYTARKGFIFTNFVFPSEPTSLGVFNYSNYSIEVIVYEDYFYFVLEKDGAFYSIDTLSSADDGQGGTQGLWHKYIMMETYPNAFHVDYDTNTKDFSINLYYNITNLTWSSIPSTTDYIIASPSSFSLSSGNTSGNQITINSNCSYLVSSNVDWIIPNIASASGDTAITFNTNATTSTAITSGYVSFVSTGITKYINVSRAALVPSLSASTSALTFDMSSSSETHFNLYSNVDWSIEIMTSEQTPWLLVSPSSGNGNSQISVSCTSGTTDKTGTLRLSSSAYGLTYDISVSGNAASVGNLVYYKSTGGGVVDPRTTTGWGATIVSNTYVDGQGIIEFDGPVTTIPQKAFSGRTGLSKIDIPSKVTLIDRTAFIGCKNLSLISIPDSVIEIGQSAFYECTGATSVQFGSGLQTIGNYAFSYNKAKNISIPSNVETIGTGAFNASQMTGLTIDAQSIGEEAFKSCQLFYSMTLGSNVSSIGKRSFSSCSRLQTIYSYAVIPPTIGTEAFGVQSSGTLHYPAGSDYSTFISALPSGWTAVADL